MKKLLWMTNRDVTVEPIVSSLDYCAADLDLLDIEKRHYTCGCLYDASGFDFVVYIGGARISGRGY